MKKYLVGTIEREKTALNALSAMFLQECERVMTAIEECKGKVIFCSVEKSARIGAKLAATFALLGISSFPAHATESVHGDPGMIKEKDIVILVSDSGTTQETIQVSAPPRSIGCTTVTCCADRDPILAKACGLTLIYPRVAGTDACSLVPTSSITLILVLGGVIACAIFKKRGFNPSDFHKFHPDGSFGKRLDDRSCIWTIHMGSHQDTPISNGKSRRAASEKELSKKRKAEEPKVCKML